MTAATDALSRGAAPGEDWRSLAICAQVNPELFHPEGPESGRLYEEQVASAKSVCAVCRVRAECLSFALEALPYGVAGGMTPDERRALAARSGKRVATPLVGEVLPGATRAEVAAAGAALLAQGRTPQAVAQACGVSERTALRWAAQARAVAV